MPKQANDLMSRPQVQAAIGCARSTIERAISLGLFPEPTMTKPKGRGERFWTRQQITDYLAGRYAPATDLLKGALIADGPERLTAIALFNEFRDGRPQGKNGITLHHAPRVDGAAIAVNGQGSVAVLIVGSPGWRALGEHGAIRKLPDSCDVSTRWFKNETEFSDWLRRVNDVTR